MKWFQPSGSNDWFGFFEKNKEIEVRITDDALQWMWTLIDAGTHGTIAATGDHDIDRFTAQTMAEFDFFEWPSPAPGSVEAASDDHSNV